MPANIISVYDVPIVQSPTEQYQDLYDLDLEYVLDNNRDSTVITSSKDHVGCPQESNLLQEPVAGPSTNWLQKKLDAAIAIFSEDPQVDEEFQPQHSASHQEATSEDNNSDNDSKSAENINLTLYRRDLNNLTKLCNELETAVPELNKTCSEIIRKKRELTLLEKNRDILRKRVITMRKTVNNKLRKIKL